MRERLTPTLRSEGALALWVIKTISDAGPIVKGTVGWDMTVEAANSTAPNKAAETSTTRALRTRVKILLPAREFIGGGRGKLTRIA